VEEDEEKREIMNREAGEREEYEHVTKTKIALKRESSVDAVGKNTFFVLFLNR
jgi:hypothetical protein